MSAMKKPLKGAVIGYGFISGKGHIPAYLQRAQKQGDVEIVAIADICAARRELAAQALPDARVYTDAKSLILAEGVNLDFVDIATPPCDHAALAHLALDHNLHVLCEKPFTVTVEEAASVLEHARRAKRVVFPVHNYKHAPVVKAIREIIDSGAIGQVRSVTLNTYRNTHAKGVTEWNTHWRRQHRYSGGGIAMDHGSHSFYLTFDWMGSYPVAVTAKMANLESGRWDTEDNFTTVLTFPNGLAHCHLTWTAGVRKQMYSVQGDRGAITVDDDNLELATMEKTDGPDVAQGAVKWKVEKRAISSNWMDASHVSWFNSLFDQFKAAIAGGDYVSKEAREAFLCVQLINNAYRSAQEGCRELPLSADVPARVAGVR
jgi:predicted dehydrogenase